ncbi:MAG: translation initiation factor IF-3, partial [Clostridiales bacterium]|nr:translation initiation factor IF-3 [Clostridiales bacterium]
DYGKYIFDLNKKEKEAKRNQKIVSVKEVRMSLGIEEHDFDVKIKNAIKFLKDSDKVKISVKFVGREFNYTKLGEELLDKFAEKISEYGTMDKRPKMEGRKMVVIIDPK